jgi:hypothetical protein
MSMDPTRLTQEYDDIRAAAYANGLSSDPHSSTTTRSSPRRRSA